MLYIVALILFAVIFLLSLHLWQAKQDLKAREYVSDFWYQKWAEEIDASIRIDDLNRQLMADLGTAGANYKALEQGRDEESEAYEMQFLSFSERIEQQDNLILHLEQIRVDHDVFCLPWLGNDFYPNAEDDEAPVYEELAITWKW